MMARQLHFVYGFLLLSLVAATAPSITELGTVSILAPGNLDRKWYRGNLCIVLHLC